MKRLLLSAALLAALVSGCGAPSGGPGEPPAAVDLTNARLVKLHLPGMT